MRTISLLIPGLLALAVHPDVHSIDIPGSVSCPDHCTIDVTIDEQDKSTPGHCKPQVIHEVVRAGPAESTITWRLTDPRFRFKAGREGRGINVRNEDDSDGSIGDERKHPHHHHVGASNNNQTYVWNVSPPQSGSEEKNNYDVKVIRRPAGECAPVDPVIVNRG